jgi:hypothetical protein
MGRGQDRSGAIAVADQEAPGAEHDISGPDAGTPAPAPAPAPAPSPPAAAPAAPAVTSTTTSGPTFGNCRAFDWVVDWSTTGRSGFIVQEITNSGSITACDGTAQPLPNTPHFWESWPVDAAGVVGDGGGDQWTRVARPNTTGSWSLRGAASFVSTLDPACHWSRSAVPDTNGLMATTTAPGNLTNPNLTRSKSSSWDCCNGHNTHTNG